MDSRRPGANRARESQTLDKAYVEHMLKNMTGESDAVSRLASLFRNGRNQAVRIPREFELEGDQVRIFKDGARLVLEPLSGRPSLLAVLAEIGPVDVDFPDVDTTLKPLDTPEL